MSKVIQIHSIDAYHRIRGIRTLHPLVSVINQADTEQAMPAGTYHFGIYAVFLKDLKCGELKYGRNNYDYQEGTLLFVAPGQIIGVPDRKEKVIPKGWILLFHPDFIHSTSLGKKIQQYSFFSYNVNEALHMSESEREIMNEQFKKIQFELNQSIDKHSKAIINSAIDLLLNYCLRFYDRQFITRENVHQGIVEKFSSLLHEYMNSDKPSSIGFPTVSYFASQLNLSANYLGDVIKQETGISPSEHIQNKIIDIAKVLIFDHQQSITGVAHHLGFKYPQHFTRIFKQKVGMSPLEYRQLN